jgi:hypothetical protein
LTHDALVADGCRGRLKVIVGGAPVTQAYADAIGAVIPGFELTHLPVAVDPPAGER